MRWFSVTILNSLYQPLLCHLRLSGLSLTSPLPLLKATCSHMFNNNSNNRGCLPRQACVSNYNIHILFIKILKRELAELPLAWYAFQLVKAALRQEPPERVLRGGGRGEWGDTNAISQAKHLLISQLPTPNAPTKSLPPLQALRIWISASHHGNVKTPSHVPSRAKLHERDVWKRGKFQFLFNPFSTIMGYFL